MEATGQGITYRDLFNALRCPQRPRQLNPCSVDSRSFLFDYIKNNIKYSIDEQYEAALNAKILAYTTTLNRKWSAVNRTASTFISKYEGWLDTKFDLPKKEKKAVDLRGRPSKPFSDLSERAKIRKVKPLVETISPDRLLRATRVSLFKKGKHAAADLLKQSTEYSPSRPAKIRKTFRESLGKNNIIVPYTVDEALAHMVNCRMTKNVYHQTRLGLKEHGVNVYPSYDRIREAKKLCYPEDIEIYEFAEFIFKWGCDGSSGQTEYHQAFTQNKNLTLNDPHSNSDGDNDTDDSEQNYEQDVEYTDANMFLFSLVPLRLTFGMTDDTNDILWKNLTPSSTRYCRPIKFLYKKETKYNTCKEVEAIENEIKALVPIEIVLNNISVPVHCKLVMTMVDGKVINNLTDTSSQRCFICNCGPKI
ncbi:uncharacterized protein LOC132943582 [Metopolophium dirhodum]|uniref:uncharacterized protein LOC132943582 n=1 Tax=Metopolophium dirhodum TaxID=44670 RepID=UPI00299037F9|nr:uncharacterized protein LOC132943582 [Metopolophium dirhodum]